jgi:hypothetical protein
MPRRLLITALAAAATLLSASTALASTTFDTDPNEPNIGPERDIEWVAVDHPPSVSGRWVRHTIKLRAPYLNTPCVYLRGDESYKLYNGAIHGNGPTTPVVVNQTPAGAPDTVSYSFSLDRIGNPTSYEWWVISCGGSGGDRAPDTGRYSHWVGFPQPAFP